MEPTIADGDLLLLNFDFHRADIPLGGVYVITLSSMLMVKRLQVTPTGNVRVISDNDLYPAEELTGEYVDEHMEINAQVVWSGGPLRRR